MILLDTHVLLWWQAGGERLSARAARAIADAEAVLVSPVTCWEVASLMVKGRIALDRDVYRWVADLLSGEHVSLAPLSAQAAVGAALLPSVSFPGDPADRLLYATARELVVPFVTKDGQIRDYARQAKDVRTLW
ncbi:MAG: type II toxin-antitoxin system VapC family toxin [Acidimicrobiales bacterium]